MGRGQGALSAMLASSGTKEPTDTARPGRVVSRVPLGTRRADSMMGARGRGRGEVGRGRGLSRVLSTGIPRSESMSNSPPPVSHLSDGKRSPVLSPDDCAPSSSVADAKGENAVSADSVVPIAKSTAPLRIPAPLLRLEVAAPSL